MRFRLIAISLLLASCSDMSMPKIPTLLAPYKMDIRQGNAVSAEMRERLKFGMTHKQVHALMGTPLVSDPFHASRWDYVYRFSHQGELVDNQRLTLYFDGDALVRIDDNGKLSTAPTQAAATPEPVAAPEAH
ncbi:MAG: outer membrane protein assembly factor BamE [Sideroxydans sp.]|nr:outer membrane protein assembly factor BamE [Sideroxydans sp.]